MEQSIFSEAKLKMDKAIEHYKKDGGVLRRTGHTEAAVDLSRLAGFKPAGVLCEIMNVNRERLWKKFG